jgi:hypothetical protein
LASDDARAMFRVLLTLLIANLLAFLWLRGSLDNYVANGREPERLDRQIDAEKLSLRSATGSAAPPAGGASAISGTAAPGASASSSVAPASPTPAAPIEVCREVTVPSGVALERVRAFFAEQGGRFKTETLGAERTVTYQIYTLPVENLATAQRKLADFKRQGFDSVSIIESGPQRLGMLIETAASASAATARLQALAQRGVRNMRIQEEESTPAVTKLRYRYTEMDSGMTAEVRTKLAGLLVELGVSAVGCGG